MELNLDAGKLIVFVAGLLLFLGIETFFRLARGNILASCASLSMAALRHLTP